MGAYTVDPWRRNREGIKQKRTDRIDPWQEQPDRIDPWSRVKTEAKPEVRPLLPKPIPAGPKGFDEKHPVAAKVLDYLAGSLEDPLTPLGAAHVTVQSSEDLAQALQQPLEGFKPIVQPGEDRYAHALANANTMLRRTGRITRDALGMLFAPISIPLAPASPVTSRLSGLADRFLKKLWQAAPGTTVTVRPEFKDLSLPDLLTTPGALTTGNPNLDPILEEIAGFLPFVVAGQAARTARGKVGPPTWKATPAELRGPPPPAEAPAPEIPARPPLEPGVIFTPEYMRKMAAEEAAVRVPVGPAPKPQLQAIPQIVRPVTERPLPAVEAPKVAPKAKAAAKEPWEMTRDEWDKSSELQDLLKAHDDAVEAGTPPPKVVDHGDFVVEALDAGKAVPQKVIDSENLVKYNGKWYDKGVASRLTAQEAKAGAKQPLATERTYAQVQAELDARTSLESLRAQDSEIERLLEQGVPFAEIEKKFSDPVSDKLRVELESIGAKELTQTYTELKKVIPLSSVSEKMAVLSQYGMRGGVDAISQSRASDAPKMAREISVETQVERVATALARERGEAFYDTKEIPRQTVLDAMEAVRGVHRYFFGIEDVIESTKKGYAEGIEAARFAEKAKAGAVPQAAAPTEGGELSANPVFDPRFWQRADKTLRPFTFKLERSIERGFGKLPFSIRKWFQEDPQLKRIMHEARTEVGTQRSETEAVLRMVLKDKPTTGELLIADRIARGVPADLSPARAPLRESIAEAAEYTHRVAQEMTSERVAMGLPVRSDWVEGPKHWYPNLWQQHIFSPRMIAGRLFGYFRKGGAAVRPSAAEMGSLKARTTDRWVVVDNSGNTVKVAEGREAIFSTAQDAEAFLEANSGYRVRFFDIPERAVKETTFPTIAERTGWVESAGESIRVREMLPGKHLRIVEPMTHEQMVGHGLIEDLTLNLRYGFGKERALIAKTRALQKLGQQLAVDTPQPGYVKLSETGFDIPAKLAERNPWIARLRDGYVPELVADGLNALYGRRGAWSNYFRAVEGTLRKWVTVYSPFRHPRNLIENYIPLAFRDPKAALDLPAMRTGFRDFVRGARGEKEVPFWEEYQGSALATTDILRGEFETVWKTIDRVNPGNMELSVAERMGIWAETNPVARRLLKTRDFVQQMYRAEDQIWKYYYFRTLRERGWAMEAAAQRARRTFFDYEDVPPYVRAVNRVVPFVPNITFQYARIILSALRDDPASAAMKVGLLMYGYAFVREKAMEAAGITKQDEENMGRVGIKWHEFPLPMTDDKGRNLIVNMQWLIPFSEIELLRYSAAEEEPAKGWGQATRRFIPMMLQPAATAISQRGAFGQPILTGAEPRGEARKKLAREVTLSALPGMLGQYWDRLYKNAAAGPEVKAPWGQKLLEGLVGRVQHIRPGERIQLRKALIAGQGREVQEEAARQRGRLIRGATSAETFQGEIGKLRERSGEEAAAHPQTLEVVKALEEGRNADARQAYKKLKQSEFYSDSDEAVKAVGGLLMRRGRLAEMGKAPLAEARQAVVALVDQIRTTGKGTQKIQESLRQVLSLLSESDQKAALDYLEDQIQIVRQERTRKLPKSKEAGGTPQYQLAPLPGGQR